MLRNYFRTAWRNLLRNRVYSLINLLGLALGLACCLLIVMYVQDEVAYDAYHMQKDRIYRVSSEMEMSGKGDHFAMSGMAVGPSLTARYPEVDTFTRFMYTSNRRTVRFEDQVFNEEAFFLADPQVFSVFSYEMLQGDPATALERPNTVVLTASIARKFFGDANPMQKRLEIGQQTYEVTGVLADLPLNTDFQFNALMSMKTLPEQMVSTFEQDWGRVIFYTYILFKQQPDLPAFEAKLVEFVNERVIPFWTENGVTGKMTYHLTALTDLHFMTDTSYDTPKGNRSYLSLFSLVALFILLIACFNYINLAIAQSARRSVEVGVRKATGAARGQLIGQFLVESLLLAGMALVLAVLWVELALPLFNELSGKSFTAVDVLTLNRLALFVGIAVVAGLVAGSYPAFFLANMKPVDVLKGQLSLGGRHWLRKTLVVMQFSISIALIIGTLIIRAQMQYMKSRDLGFQKDQLLVVEVPKDTTVQNQMSALEQELLSHPAITEVGACNNGLPGQNTSALLMRVEVDGQLREDQFKVSWIDDRFFETMRIDMVEGRNFDRSRGTDQQQGFIVNEAFVKQIGWENPIGKRMQWGLMGDNQAVNDGRVVGVVKDYHYTSLHNPIEPLVLLFAPQGCSRQIIRLDGQKVAEGLAFTQEVWRKRDPRHPLEYFFLDQFFDRQYEDDAHLMRLFSYFSGLTILIACMGLFGLASFITRQRTKEIGIRKVLGAERGHIVFLIARDFAWLVGIAIGIASVATWLVMKDWLQGFAFATDMPVYAYILAGGAALSVALLATSYHTLRVSRGNPVEALRYE